MATVEELQANVTALQEQLSALTSLFNANVSVLSSGISSNEASLSSFVTDVDTFFVLVGAVLVIFMQCGFCLLEVGIIAEKHTKNILIKNVLDLCVAAMTWYSLGYGLAMGPAESKSIGLFLGTDGYFASGLGFRDETGNYGTPEGYTFAVFLFQLAFSGAASTIVGGACGERITLVSYGMFSAVLVGFIYPVAARWAWNTEGWASAFRETDLLFGCGVVDFAGSGVVHTIGGTAALVVISVIGPRLNRFEKDGTVRVFPNQSTAFMVVGTFILWVGWLGFNGMSTLYLGGYGHVAAKAMVASTLSGASGGLSTCIIGFLLYGQTSPDEICNGILSGLVSITGSCSVVQPDAAVIIGAIGAICFIKCRLLLLHLLVDDVVDAVPVHMACGFWGMIAPGLFATRENYSQAYYQARADHCCGFLYGCGVAQLGANVVFLLVLMAWVTPICLVVISGCKWLKLLRISQKAELRGTDSEDHGGKEVSEDMQVILDLLRTTGAERSSAAAGGGGIPGGVGDPPTAMLMRSASQWKSIGSARSKQGGPLQQQGPGLGTGPGQGKIQREYMDAERNPMVRGSTGGEEGGGAVGGGGAGG